MIRNNRGRLIMAAGLLVIGLCCTFWAAGYTNGPEVHEITMTAKSYTFDPSMIELKKGEKVRLVITAIDRDHGIKIAGYDIDQVLKKGAPTTIEFTAAKPGKFEFKCSVFCGMGHRKMKGMLKVEE